MRGRGGGSKAVWNFSENSSILEGEGVPYPTFYSPHEGSRPGPNLNKEGANLISPKKWKNTFGCQVFLLPMFF